MHTKGLYLHLFASPAPHLPIYLKSKHGLVLRVITLIDTNEEILPSMWGYVQK